MNHLLNSWLSGSEEGSGAIRKELEQKMDSYAAGKLEHAVDVVSSIWEMSNKEGTIPSVPELPSDRPQVSPPQPNDFWNFAETRRSLIKSINEGHLFNRKYWARRSQGGAIEPIYFFDAVIRAELLRFNPSESLYLWGC